MTTSPLNKIQKGVIYIFTVKKHGCAEIIEKRSKFIANVYPVDSQKEAVEFINKIKKEAVGAKHVVYAYIIDGETVYTKYSEDGEPQGTAGVPILDLMQKMKLRNTLITVTRYFGGILLGTGGLVKAYTEAAKKGIKEAEKIEVIKKTKIDIEFSYDLKDKISFYLQKQLYEEKDIYYGEKIRMSVNIPDEEVEIFKKQIVELTDGNILIVN